MIGTYFQRFVMSLHKNLFNLTCCTHYNNYKVSPSILTSKFFVYMKTKWSSKKKLCNQTLVFCNKELVECFVILSVFVTEHEKETRWHKFFIWKLVLALQNMTLLSLEHKVLIPCLVQCKKIIYSCFLDFPKSLKFDLFLKIWSIIYTLTLLNDDQIADIFLVLIFLVIALLLWSECNGIGFSSLSRRLSTGYSFRSYVTLGPKES